MEAAQLMEDLVDNFEEGEGDDELLHEDFNLSSFNKTALGILMAQLSQFQQKSTGNFGPGPSASSNVPTTIAATIINRNPIPNCSNIMLRCDEKPLWEALMGYGFLVVFCLALVGNCINLLIYKTDQIRFFIAIRMLCTKLLMNTCMMITMLPQALRVVRLWEIGGPIDKLYWEFWPYQAYLTNVFGFCAMWLTVLMTAECYIHIFFPSKSKSLCTKRTVWRSYFVILFAALVMASIYPLNRTVSISTKCNRTIVKINTSQNPVMGFFERLHTLADMFLSILLPLTLLVFMTAMIVWRLWVWPNRHRRRMLLLANGGKTQENGLLQNGTMTTTSLLSTAAHHERKKRENHFAAEKRGVTRITLISCILQLVTETPSMSVLIYASMYGVNVHREEYICTWQTVSYFLCLCNASLSFFVYITFSTRFRKTMIHRVHQLLHRLCPSIFVEVPTYDSGLLIRPKWSRQRLQNFSSFTHSQMVTMTSKSNSPRNGSQCQGCQQNNGTGNGQKQCKHALLVVKKSAGGAAGYGNNGNGGMDGRAVGAGGLITTLMNQENTAGRGNELVTQTKSEPPTTHNHFPFTIAKRILQQNLTVNGTTPTAALYLPENNNNYIPETSSSQEAIPTAIRERSKSTKESDNGGTHNKEAAASMGKRSSVCSTTTQKSGGDTFL